MISSHAVKSFKIPHDWNLRAACRLSVVNPIPVKTFFIVCILRGRQRGHSQAIKEAQRWLDIYCS